MVMTQNTIHYQSVFCSTYQHSNFIIIRTAVMRSHYLTNIHILIIIILATSSSLPVSGTCFTGTHPLLPRSVVKEIRVRKATILQESSSKTSPPLIQYNRKRDTSSHIFSIETSRRKVLTDLIPSLGEEFTSGRALAIGGAAGLFLAGAGITISDFINRNPYPREHEQRIRKLFETTFRLAHSTYDIGNASPASVSTPRNTFRILEVGIGSQCRSIMKGLYDDALLGLSEADDMPQEIEMIGVDINSPTDETLAMAEDWLQFVSPTPISLSFINGDIGRRLEMFPDGFFDAITCSMVLCSVTDQVQALAEIKRLLNKKGGTFGYIEHCAVDLHNKEERGMFLLDLQQRALDPLQASVSHNCHLHRNTDDVISQVFGLGTKSAIDSSPEAISCEHSRFVVNGMWPCSMQCSGVIKMNAEV